MTWKNFFLGFVIYVTVNIGQLDGFVQEIVFHESFADNEPGNSFFYRTHVSDTSLYSLKNISRICYTGVWIGYSKKNFIQPRQNFTGPGCVAPPAIEIAQIMSSFRFLGASDTETSAVSLYEGLDFDGDELRVTRSPYAGITGRFNSLALSGQEGWTLFEGTNFNGNSMCLMPTRLGLRLQPKLPLRRIGSLYKGCNL